MRRVTGPAPAVLLIGADYRRANAPQREPLAAVAAGFHSWIDKRLSRCISEGFALSTCHRVEFYVATGDASAATNELRALAQSLTGTDPLGPQGPLTHLDGGSAIRHLCRVTSGLESMLLGEHEISGQVRRAALDARTVGALGPTLSAVVTAALTCSGRVRNETQIGQGSASLASVAVESAARALNLSRSRVLLIGAGAVAREAARRLMRHQPESLSVASRSHEHARALAGEVNGQALDFGAIPGALGDSDVCIAAISGTANRLGEAALSGLRDFQLRALSIVDLSLPRLFDSSATSVPGVRLLSIDELGVAAETVHAHRLSAVPAAEAIVEDETRRALARLDVIASRLVSMNRTLRLGTRGTPLALRQTDIVIAALRRVTPDLQISVVVIRAEGDDVARPAWTTDSPGLFTNTLTRALVDDEIDAAVHSLKDLPVRVGPVTALSAILEREDPSDVLVDFGGRTLETLPTGAVVGTCSLRRRAQLLERRPDLRVAEIRGGVVHRLEVLSGTDSRFAAIVLARAGLARLDRTDAISDTFPAEHWLPAPGQAAIAVEVRAADRLAFATTEALDHLSTRIAVAAERSVLSALGAGCHAPVGAWARSKSPGRYSLSAAAWSLDGRRVVRIDDRAVLTSEADAEAFGRTAADQLLDRGAASLLTPEALADAHR